MRERPRLLLVLPDARARLRLVAALGTRAELHALAEGEEPLRLARSLRPDLVLLAHGRRSTAELLALSRGLKTEPGHCPRVVLFDPEGRLRHPMAALESGLADGILGRDLGEEPLWTFLDRVLRGERPVEAGPRAPRGLLARLRGR